MPFDLDVARSNAVHYLQRALQFATGVSPVQFDHDEDRWQICMSLVILVDSILRDWEKLGGCPVSSKEQSESRRIRNKLSHTSDSINPRLLQAYILDHYPQILDVMEQSRKAQILSRSTDRTDEAIEEAAEAERRRVVEQWIQDYDAAQRERSSKDGGKAKDTDVPPSHR